MKNNLHILPIELLEERYTKQVFKWLTDELKRRSVNYKIYLPRQSYKSIQHGQFLDIGGTLHFKLKQLDMVIDALQKGIIKDGDVLFVMDIWFPGIESVRYYTDLMGFKNFKIIGMQHAGRSDYMDFIRQAGAWSDPAEHAFLECCNLIFAGGGKWTEYLMKKHFPYLSAKVVKAFLWNPEDVRRTADKGNISAIKLPKHYLIFPHRTSFEKNYAELYYIADKIKLDIVVTSSGKINLPYRHPKIMYIENISKAQYYKIMQCANLYLSLSYQDHFALTPHEALALRVPLLVKDTVAYRQYVPKRYLCDGTNKVIQRINNYEKISRPTELESNTDADLTKLLVNYIITMLGEVK